MKKKNCCITLRAAGFCLAACGSGSGFSGTIETIAELQPDAAVISNGLSISRDSVADAESDVVDWVDGLGITVE